MLEASLTAFYLVVPILVLWLSKHVALINKMGAVTICYIVGILFGNFSGVTVPESFVTESMGAAVMLAIPLLLFSADFGVWRRMGLRLSKSFFLCVIAVTISVVIGAYLFRGSSPDTWIHASMLMGVYTGGAPNLAAIGLALGVEESDFLVISAVEMLFGGMWLLALLTFVKPLLLRVFRRSDEQAAAVEYTIDERMYWKTSPLAFLIAALIVAIAVGLGGLFFDVNNKAQQPFFMTTAFLVVTSLGIAGSAIPFVQKLKGSYGLGNFLLLVFCVAVGSLANVKMIYNAAPGILGLVAFVMFTTIVLHLIFSWIFKVDVDTFIISSAAAIFGPPFIPPIAKAIRAPYLVPVGLALGVLGLAIGNYCGIGISHLLR